MSISDKLTVIAENVPKVFEAGQQTERDTFWDSFQGGGKRTNYAKAFLGVKNLNRMFYPIHDLNITVCGEMFRGVTGEEIDLAQRIKDCGVNFDTSQCTTFELMCAYSHSILTFPILSFESVTNSYYTSVFSNCYNLKTVEKIILSPVCGVYPNAFQNCTALENITFEGTLVGNGLNLQWSPNLTHDSLMSVINCLEDKSADTSGTSWVVTVGPTNLAKLTTEELAIAHNKGWDIV